jgi:hypothetical protein
MLGVIQEYELPPLYENKDLRFYSNSFRLLLLQPVGNSGNVGSSY